MRRIFHGIEVVEITEELVEAVDGGQEFILVAKMVLAELPGGVALRFERGGNRTCLSWKAGWRTGLTNRGHARANGKFARDEVGAPGRATRFRVVVGKEHAFLGQLIEV